MSLYRLSNKCIVDLETGDVLKDGEKRRITSENARLFLELLIQAKIEGHYLSYSTIHQKLWFRVNEDNFKQSLDKARKILVNQIGKDLLANVRGKGYYLKSVPEKLDASHDDFFAEKSKKTHNSPQYICSPELLKELFAQDDDTIYTKLVDLDGKTKLVEIRIVNSEVLFALHTGIYFEELTNDIDEYLFFTNTNLIDAGVNILGIIFEGELMFVEKTGGLPSDEDVETAYFDLRVAPAPFMFGFEALAAGDCLDDNFYDIEYLIKKRDNMTAAKSSEAIYSFGDKSEAQNIHY